MTPAEQFTAPPMATGQRVAVGVNWSRGPRVIYGIVSSAFDTCISLTDVTGGSSYEPFAMRWLMLPMATIVYVEPCP